MHFAALFFGCPEQLHHLYSRVHHLEHRVAFEVGVNEFGI